MLTLLILVSVPLSNALAQTLKTTQRGSFISVNGDISSGHIISPETEGNALAQKSIQALGSLNLGWFNYWNHFSCEVQFTTSPFVGSLSGTNNIRTLGMQFWFGYSVFENEIFRASPVIGFGSYNFHVASGAGTTNAHTMIGISGEAFLPDSPIMLGLRGGYQHNFLMPSDANGTVMSASGAVVQLRTGIRLF